MSQVIHSNKSQCAEILLYLKRFGKINTPTARGEFKCERLASRINDLRKEGYKIKTIMYRNELTGKRFAIYSMERDNA